MTDNALMRAAMASKAKSRRDPDWAAQEQELVHRLTWGRHMLAEGRLSKSEFAEYESSLAASFIDGMPTEQYVAMQADGSFSDLEVLARGHDGKRDSHSVLQDRKKLSDRITADALDTALSEGKIDARRYNQERTGLGSFDDDRTRRVNDAADDAEHDDIALDFLLETTMPEGDQAPLESYSDDSDRVKDASED